MGEGELYSDRRKFARKDTFCRVKYKVLSAEQQTVDIKKSMERKTAQSSDLSVGGMKIAGEIDAKKGDVIRVEFIFEEREPVTTFAEVKWIKPEEKEFGIEFLILKDKDKEFIENL
ncbi:MAG TPA: PilZ domain-containing protein [Firmicutes bacterium]|nr:PilZ domain-containing protein [Bacillota bacterium]